MRVFVYGCFGENYLGNLLLKEGETFTIPLDFLFAVRVYQSLLRNKEIRSRFLLRTSQVGMLFNLFNSLYEKTNKEKL